MPRYAASVLAVCLASCAISDSHTAKQARTSLVGLSEVDLESCIGTPDHKDKFGATEILTYNGASTSTGGVSLNLPILGTLNVAGGGYCHMTVRVDDGRATQIRYSGETDATFGPDAYCAPIVRECLRAIQARSASTATSAAPR
jgi:hypothetical protein